LQRRNSIIDAGAHLSFLGQFIVHGQRPRVTAALSFAVRNLLMRTGVANALQRPF
jgi:hypothetical protein